MKVKIGCVVAVLLTVIIVLTMHVSSQAQQSQDRFIRAERNAKAGDWDVYYDNATHTEIACRYGGITVESYACVALNPRPR